MDQEKIPFEDGVRRLEQIVEMMEKKDLPLENAMDAYEEGIHLIRHCRKLLDEAQGRIEALEKAKSTDTTETDLPDKKKPKVRKKKVEVSEKENEPILKNTLQGKLF